MKSKSVDAVIFDLDGVITNSTPLHSSAWKEMFDQFLKDWANINSLPFHEFTHQEDYLAYVDGKPRYIGVKSFLESRGIDLPFGDPTDEPGQNTVCALGNKKNELYNQLLSDRGVEIYASSVEFIHQLKDAGISLGLATSSKNAARVLDIAGLKGLFQIRIDGSVSAELGLEGKPSPDIFHTACDRLGASYERSVVIEDANSGVQAGYRGYFGLVIGVAREDNREELELHGADLVVEDLSEISLNDLHSWFSGGEQKRSWSIEYHSYDPDREGTRETLCVVGNGYFCTRGALEETPAIPDSNYPGTYLAGLYNKLESKIAGRSISNEDFVNCPNWLPISFKIGSGDWFSPHTCEIIDFHRKLDFKTGLLTKTMLVQDSENNRTRIQSTRFISMADPNMAGISYSITPLNYAGTISIKTELDGTVTNQGVKRYLELSSNHLSPVSEGGSGQLSYLGVKTNQSAIGIGLVAKLEVKQGDIPCSPQFQVNTVPGKVSTTFEMDVRSDKPICVEKVVAIYSSNLPGTRDPLEKARSKIKACGSYPELIEESAAAWDSLWDRVDLKIKGDRLVQKMVRLHIYHTLVSVSKHTALIDAGIPARGLHGEAYRGHIFWDELYVMPFFDFHLPESAQGALRYRYKRLDKARESAREDELRGAQFPWQSGSDGSEATQSLHLNPISGKWGPDYSHHQRHVSLAIAFNLWNYYWITRDTDFLLEAGAELFLSICIYWSDMAVEDPETGRFSIKYVMGPDEFHETYPDSNQPGLIDNAYTNIMAAWMFKTASDLLDILPDNVNTQILKELSISSQDLLKWEKLTRKINIPINNEGILEQFSGYFDLKELDWEHYKKTYQDIHRMDRILKSEGLSPNDYKIAKQADTLMTFYNLSEGEISTILTRLGYKLPPDLLSRNLHYYLQRTSHGSTLSRLVHAYLAHQTQNYELSWKLFQEALSSDYLDIQGGTTKEGIHLGVMTGTILFLYRAYAGLDWRGDILSVSPRLPTGWQEMSFSISYKSGLFNFVITREKVKVKLEGLKKGSIMIYDQLVDLKSGEWAKTDLIR